MKGRLEIRPLAALLLAAATAAALTGCGATAGNEAASRGADVAVLAASDLATVGRADLATGVLVQGTLEPAMDVNLNAPFPEALDEVTVKEGQAVAAGQVLARFRTASIAPAAAGAEAARRVAAADYARMQTLFKEGAVSQRDVDGAEAQLRAAEAQAALAGKRLGEASVRAPFAGVIAKRFVQGGDRVADGDPLFRLVNTGELEFSASVPTGALAGVRPGAPVVLTVSGLGGTTVTGRVARINATVDPATRQVKLYVTVPNRDRRLAGDMFATGRVVLGAVKGVVALPSGAVQSAGGGTYTWVVAAGKLEKRPLAVGLRDELADMVEVRSGLAGGETVVVSPMEALTPGQPVQVGGAGAAAPAAGTPAAQRPATQPAAQRAGQPAAGGEK